MSAKSKSNIGIGIAFVVAGLFLLAYRFGYIDFNIFWSLLTLWPLLFVVIGVSLIFRRNPWVKGLAWILFIVAVVAYGYLGDGNFRFLGGRFLTYDLTEVQIETPLQEDTKEGHLELKLGVGNVDIGSTDDYTMTAAYPDEITRVTSAFDSNGDYSLKLEHDDHYLPRPRPNTSGFNYRIDLQEGVLWSIDSDVGAVDMQLDLRDIAISVLDLDMGAGDLDLYLGDISWTAQVDIDSGVSDVKLYIPEEMPLRLRFDGGIKDIHFSSASNFNKDGEDYVTDGFDQTQPHYEMEISTGVGSLTIDQY